MKIVLIHRLNPFFRLKIKKCTHPQTQNQHLYFMFNVKFTWLTLKPFITHQLYFIHLSSLMKNSFSLFWFMEITWIFRIDFDLLLLFQILPLFWGWHIFIYLYIYLFIYESFNMSATCGFYNAASICYLYPAFWFSDWQHAFKGN